MTERTVWLHTAIASVVLVVAFMAWQSPDVTATSTSVVIVPGQAERLQRLHYRDDQGEVEVVREQENIWVDVLRKGRDADAGTEGGETKRFPGNQRAEELFKSMAPLQGVRDLGAVEQPNLQAMGLADVKSAIHLGYGNNTNVVHIGDRAYGGANYYVRPESGNRVYLLAAGTLANLQNGATTILERRALPVDKEKITLVRFQNAGNTHVFVQQNSSDRSNAYFAREGNAEERLNDVGTWMDKVFRLRAADVGAAAPVGEPALVLEVERDGGKRATLKLWSASGNEAIAESSEFPTPIKLSGSSVEDILTSLPESMK